MNSNNNDKLGRLEMISIHFKNELKAISKDSGAMLILIGAMFIYPVIYSIGYFNETLTDLKIAVVDLDHSSASRKYTGMIDATPELVVSCKPEDLKQAEALFLKNKINGVVLIPKGFQKDVLSGRQANVAVYADASYFLKYRNEYMAVSYANACFGGGISVKRYMAEGKSFEQAAVAASPLSVQTHVLYNPATGYGSFVMPGLILIIIQQTLLIGIGLLGGSFSESKASPFLLPCNKRKKEILPFLAGKSGAYLLISAVNIALAVVLVHHWFGYPDKANMLDILMLLFPYLLAVIFLGIGLSTLFKHRESALVFMVFLSPIALFLSGLSWPVSAIPDWLVMLSKVMPSTTVVPAYLRLRTMGAGLTEIKHELVTLYWQAGIYAAFSIAYFFLRVYLEKHEMIKEKSVC